MTTVPIVLGLLIGACILCLFAELRAPRPSLAERMAHVYTPPHLAQRHTVLSAGWLRAMVLALVRRVGLEGRIAKDVAADCRVMGVSLEAHVMNRVAGATVGLVAGPAIALFASLAGMKVSVVFPVWASLLGAAMGFVQPGMKLRAEAAKRRRSFIHALSAFFDSVGMRVAGGISPDAAVRDAASNGDDWAFGEIRQALYRASRDNKTTWQALSDLGDELKIRELSELASAVQLSIEMGALLGQSLTDMAKTVRHEILSDVRSLASRATTRMSIANAMLGLSFVMLVVYAVAGQIVVGGK